MKILDQKKEIQKEDLTKLLKFYNASPSDTNEIFFKSKYIGLEPQFSLDLSNITLKYLVSNLLSDMDFGPIDRVIRKFRKGIVINFLDSKSDIKMLDLGCGRQATLGWNIRSQCEKYIGLDRDIPAVKYKNMEFVTSTVEEIAQIFKPESFNVIAALALIEHIDDPKKFINDCYQLLEKGGHLLLTTPQPFSDPILRILANMGIINGEEVDEHKTYFTPETLSTLLKKEKFEIVEKRSFLLGFNVFVVGRK